MSKRKYLGSALDQVCLQPTNRAPVYKVVIWNPNRTDIHDVVLGAPESPEYDITPWVTQINYNENIVFENNDDAIASNCVLEMLYDSDAQPIEITERTMLDGTPIRIFQGDVRIPKEQWIPIFTGVLRGVPTTTGYSREERRAKSMTVTAVDRAEKYLNKLVTARAYTKGMDVGKAATETAIEWMYLDRRETRIGDQQYYIGHEYSQLVDIEVLKGIAQILFTVGKKPRFDAEGLLVAADTDLDKPPIRTFQRPDFVRSISRDQVMTSVNNSVRLLGLDANLTQVVEQDKRLAHGTITSGFFETRVTDKIYFSENPGKEKQGRRAKNTYLGKEKVSSIGDAFGENLDWRPNIEDDGYTVFSGELVFDTGVDLTIRAVLLANWIIGKGMAIAGVLEENPVLEATGEGIAMAALIGMILSMTEIGRVYWEIWGEPFQNVHQQLAATSVAQGLLTEDIKETELRNDWLYDIEYMRTRCRELLRRELIKGWGYEILMLDDPFVEVDDIIAIDMQEPDPLDNTQNLVMKFYITSIRKALGRPGDGLMKLKAWRVQ